jgi:site-specific recombinase XerC
LQHSLFERIALAILVVTGLLWFVPDRRIKNELQDHPQLITDQIYTSLNRQEFFQSLAKRIDGLKPSDNAKEKS